MARAMSPAKRKKTASKSSKEDIIEMILEDHKPLKKLIKVLKDSDEDLKTRRKAFEDFAPLLIQHAKPEEQVLYVFMKNEEELREEGFEGEVEHVLADQLIEEAKRSEDDDVWSARVKVLAEVVEHHIEEEEDELLPKFKKATVLEMREELGREFMDAKNNMTGTGSEKNPAQFPDIHAPM